MRLSSLLTRYSPLAAFILASVFAHPVSAQNRTTEQGEAQITDPNQECTPYDYPPVTQALAAFPPIWSPATIVANDNNAQALYQNIQSQIPDIPPNGYQPGSIDGDFLNFTYPSSDPNCWWTADQCTTPKLAGLPSDLINVPEPDTLGYGFDDGPNCSHNAFYDYLQQNNQKATMFYIGSNVADWPLEAQRGLADGHEICVHTWSHHYMTALTNEEVFAELYYCIEMIKLVIGITPTCWRPPFGDVDDRVRAIAHALGLRTIVWTYDSYDWSAGINGYTDADVNANYENLISLAQNGTFSTRGTIMLTHELNNFTMSEAVTFLDQLKSAFKYVVPMGVATNQTQPYVETNYSLPNFEQYIAGTTVLTGGVAIPTSTLTTSSFVSVVTTSVARPSASSAHSSANGAGHSSIFGSLVVSAAFVCGILQVLM